MFSVFRLLIFLVVTLLLAMQVSAQSGARGTASITGRITTDDRPLPGVKVVIFPSGLIGPERRPLYHATTDEEGRYRFSAITAGQYRVTPLAPAYTTSAGISDGKPVTLSENEAIDNLDFVLGRGGVITGRVTDANDQPVIEEPINLIEIEEGGRNFPVYLSHIFSLRTDDRGIYRIYGVQPGRYLVSVGQASNVVATYGAGRPAMSQTFHPGTTNESEATPIEVTASSETTRVDIIVGKLARTYEATGRVIDADTGRPVAGIGYSYGLVGADGLLRVMNYGPRTSARGDFQIADLKAGKYRILITAENNGDYYSEPFNFEVINSNVTGLELKARRGASISGIAVVEGTTDAQIISQISQLEIRMRTDEKGSLPSSENVKIRPDGSFVISGLSPGKNIFFILPFRTPKGFTIARVEKDEMDVTAGIELRPGEQATGVKLVLAYGSSTLRGEVRVVGGTLPEGARLSATLYAKSKAGAPANFVGIVAVDTRGRFIFEGLSAGEYELTVGAFIPGRQQLPPVKQLINITGDTEIAVTLDLTPRE